MSSVQGFAYGEHRDGPQQRSLGFRLLAPQKPAAWSEEVESLARRLHAAPYPDHWPPAELMCSVILESGERLVGVARYGIRDHTPSHRPGGLEFFGVVGPSSISTDAIRIYHGLKSFRSNLGDSVGMDRDFASHVWPELPPETATTDPVPILPVQVLQHGVLLFAASTPGEPDARLTLRHMAGEQWQWLPLVGNDFPLRDFAKRGFVIAWTPYLAPMAVMVNFPNAPSAPTPPVRTSVVAPLLSLVILVLILVNLALTIQIMRKSKPHDPPVVSRETPSEPGAQPAEPREQLALALSRYWQKNGTIRDATAAQLMANYERLVLNDPDFRATSPEAKVAIGGLAHLARRSPAQIETTARQALDGKGYDPELVQMICRKIRERLNDTAE